MRAIFAALLLAGAVGSFPPNLFIVDARKPADAAGTGLWRPTTDQAIAARAMLRRYLITPPATLRPWEREQALGIATRFDSYTIQAEGVRAPGPREAYGTEGDGPRQIHLDGFCPGLAAELWPRVAQEQQVVFDGGACVFQASYDVASGSIVAFSVNGVA